MRPTLRLLDNSLIGRILDEARQLLCQLGVEVHNDEVLGILGDHGASVDLTKKHAVLTQSMIDTALGSSPGSFALFDVLGDQTHDFAGERTYYTPGSTAITILDRHTGQARKPITSDYVEYAKLLCGLPEIASQSTAFIPGDVHELISDSYRLYLSLLYGEKPVVTGGFTIEAFEIMKELQLAVRGNEMALRQKPLTIFSCCPTSPIKWSDVTSQNLIDCGRYGIPVEFISMPLSGFMAPVTVVGSVIQHAAETLSGVVIAQLANPGAPMLWGGSPAVFDIRYETTPMGAVETMMQDCANAEVGKHLGLPTQGYIGMSDAKQLDAQAGLESSMGATLAVLAGIDNVSGPGMLDFESCQSLEKLVVDHEICGLTQRLGRGVEPRDDFPALPLFEELLRDKHLLIAKHTRKHLKEEIHFPGPTIERANRARWLEEGSLTLRQRVGKEVDRILGSYRPSRLSDDAKAELTRLMEAEARRVGMEALPDRPAE